MEPENNKIVSPVSNRNIIIGGQAYNNLLQSGYTNDYLLSLNKVEKIKSPKTNRLIIKNGQTYKQLVSEGYYNPILPDKLYLF